MKGNRNKFRSRGKQHARCGRSGININVRDTANGWPSLTAPGVMQAAMNYAVGSHDAETNAKTQLNAQAAQFNQAALSFPSNLVARSFGFIPWRFPSGRSKRRR